jgi:sugar lactone lactonase YvrE
MGMGSTFAAGGLLSSGAFTSVSADRNLAVSVADDTNAFLQLRPCPNSPNGEYAQSSNGMLEIDLTGDNQQVPGTGVNADATSRFDDVFQIRNQGTQPVAVWLELPEAKETPNGEPRIEFYRSGDPSTDIAADDSSLNAKCLNPGEEGICVGFIVRTHGLDSGADETDLFDMGTTPGSNGEEMVVNADVDAACGVPEEEVPGDDGDVPTEGLYLTDTGDGQLSSGQTTLYEVDLVDSGQKSAYLDDLLQKSSGDFTQVDSLAATPDGDFLYLYDKNSGRLGKYDVDGESFTDIGEVDNDPGGVVLGEFSPDGQLWVASQNDNTLYTVEDRDTDPTVDQENGIQVDLSGADIAFTFTADSTLYLWSSDEAENGLYSIDIDAANPTAQPITQPPGSIDDRDLTGLALKDPDGDTLLGSDKEQNEIVEIETASGTIVDSYGIELGEEGYNLGFGDLASPTSVTVGTSVLPPEEEPGT